MTFQTREESLTRQIKELKYKIKVFQSRVEQIEKTLTDLQRKRKEDDTYGKCNKTNPTNIQY